MQRALVDAGKRHIGIGHNMRPVLQCLFRRRYRIPGKAQVLHIVKIRRGMDHPLENAPLRLRDLHAREILLNDRHAPGFDLHRLMIQCLHLFLLSGICLRIPAPVKWCGLPLPAHPAALPECPFVLPHPFFLPHRHACRCPWRPAPQCDIFPTVPAYPLWKTAALQK